MKRGLVLFFLILHLGAKAQVKYLNYNNVVIFSDLSNRVDNKKFPNKDFKEIHKIIQFFKYECVKPGMKIGDKSVLSFSTFSDNQPLILDLDNIVGQSLTQKQAFVNSTGSFKNSGLNKVLLNFELSIKSIYNKERNPGLDLISLLIEKIENKNFIKESTKLTKGNTEVINQYENHFFVFTDGYLEFNKNGSSSQFYFGAKQIEKLRSYCINKNVDVNTALKTQKSLRLPKYFKEKNRLINIHLLETHERDKNPQSLTYKNPIGLRDNEILEAVWRNWAEESGFKSFTWKKY